MGVLKYPDTQHNRYSKLTSTKYLPSLEGVVWSETPEEKNTLDKSLQLFFRRHRIDFQILKHPSDPKTKFDLFQRLNRGGAYANEQEVRTCSMVLANLNVTQKLRELVKREDFEKIFRVTDDQRQNQKDLEYAVRLVVHTYEYFPRGSDVQEFLDQAILKVMSEQNSISILTPIKWSIETLFRLFGEKALIPPNDAPVGIAPRFSLRALEGIAVGLSRNRGKIIKLQDSDKFIRAKVQDFWSQPEVGDMSAPGLRGSVRLQRSVEFGSKWFLPNA